MYLRGGGRTSEQAPRRHPSCRARFCQSQSRDVEPNSDSGRTRGNQGPAPPPPPPRAGPQHLAPVRLPAPAHRGPRGCAPRATWPQLSEPNLHRPFNPFSARNRCWEAGGPLCGPQQAVRRPTPCHTDGHRAPPLKTRRFLARPPPSFLNNSVRSHQAEPRRLACTGQGQRHPGQAGRQPEASGVAVALSGVRAGLPAAFYSPQAKRGFMFLQG